MPSYHVDILYSACGKCESSADCYSSKSVLRPDSQKRFTDDSTFVCLKIILFSPCTVPLMCPAPCAERPPELRYGLVRFHTMRHGARARYKCNPGFEHIGDNYLTCLHGKWTGNVPTCREGPTAYLIPYIY